jgi:hypothetical protein
MRTMTLVQVKSTRIIARGLLLLDLLLSTCGDLGRADASRKVKVIIQAHSVSSAALVRGVGGTIWAGGMVLAGGVDPTAAIVSSATSVDDA